MITLPAQNKDNTEEENYKELQKIAKEYKDENDRLASDI